MPWLRDPVFSERRRRAHDEIGDHWLRTAKGVADLQPRATHHPWTRQPPAALDRRMTDNPYPRRRRALSPEDWSAMRLAYETTDASLRDLAGQYGLRSTGSIRHRRDNENWRRDVHAIAANITTRTLASVALGDTNKTLDQEVEAFEQQAGQKAGQPCAGAVLGQHNPAQGSEFETDVRAIAYRRAAAGRRDPDFVERRRQARDEIEEHFLETAKLHAGAIREQLDSVQAAITGTDEEQVSEARARLLALNPERETLAGLLKAINGIGEWAMLAQRRALGMDQPKDVGETKTPVIPEGVKAALGRLSGDTLRELRQAALEVSQLPASGNKTTEETPS